MPPDERAHWGLCSASRTWLRWSLLGPGLFTDRSITRLRGSQPSCFLLPSHTPFVPAIGPTQQPRVLCNLNSDPRSLDPACPSDEMTSANLSDHLPVTKPSERFSALRALCKMEHCQSRVFLKNSSPRLSQGPPSSRPQSACLRPLSEPPGDQVSGDEHPLPRGHHHRPAGSPRTTFSGPILS